jgi:hypothetical protein
MINYQGSTVWVVIVSANGIPDQPDIFSNKQAAIDTFSTYVRELNGDPMEVDFKYKVTIWHDDDLSEANVSIRMYEETVRHKE